MMDEKLREELLALETETPSLREKYEKELRDMIEKPLQPWQKFLWKFMMGMSIFLGLVFGGTALFVAAELPLYSTVVFLVGSVVCFAWAYSAYRIVQSGKSTIPKLGFSVGIMWMFVVFMMVVSLLVGTTMEDTAKGNQMILYAFVFLFIGALFMIQHFIERSEQSTKEQLLKLELHLMELNEKLSQEKNLNSTKD